MMLDALAGKGAVRIDKSQSLIEQLTHRVQVSPTPAPRFFLIVAPHLDKDRVATLPVGKKCPNHFFFFIGDFLLLPASLSAMAIA